MAQVKDSRGLLVHSRLFAALIAFAVILYWQWVLLAGGLPLMDVGYHLVVQKMTVEDPRIGFLAAPPIWLSNFMGGLWVQAMDAVGLGLYGARLGGAILGALTGSIVVWLIAARFGLNWFSVLGVVAISFYTSSSAFYLIDYTTVPAFLSVLYLFASAEMVDDAKTDWRRALWAAFVGVLTVVLTLSKIVMILVALVPIAMVVVRSALGLRTFWVDFRMLLVSGSVAVLGFFAVYVYLTQTDLFNVLASVMLTKTSLHSSTSIFSTILDQLVNGGNVIIRLFAFSTACAFLVFSIVHSNNNQAFKFFYSIVLRSVNFLSNVFMFRKKIGLICDIIILFFSSIFIEMIFGGKFLRIFLFIVAAYAILYFIISSKIFRESINYLFEKLKYVFHLVSTKKIEKLQIFLISRYVGVFLLLIIFFSTMIELNSYFWPLSIVFLTLVILIFYVNAVGRKSSERIVVILAGALCLPFINGFGTSSGLFKISYGMWALGGLLPIVWLAWSRVAATPEWGRLLRVSAFFFFLGLIAHGYWAAKRTVFGDHNDRELLTAEMQSSRLAGIYTTPGRQKSFDALVAAVEERTEPGDLIVAYSYLGLLNYATDTRPLYPIAWSVISDINLAVNADAPGTLCVNRMPKVIVRSRTNTFSDEWGLVFNPRYHSDRFGGFVEAAKWLTDELVWSNCSPVLVWANPDFEILVPGVSR